MSENEYIFCRGTSLNNPPAGYYTAPRNRYSTGHIYGQHRHIGCYAFNKYGCGGRWGVYPHRNIPDTYDSPDVVFSNGRIYHNGWALSVIACYGNGEIWKNNQLIGVYDGPDAGGAATAALVFGWAR